MIVTITLNPAVDRTLFVPNFKPNEENHTESAHMDPGGHGISVCRALRMMGTASRACGFIGGQNGRIIKDYLNSVSIPFDFVEVKGETRINIKIIDGNGGYTEINDSGFEVADSDYDRLKERISQYMTHENKAVLCGAPTRNFDIEKYAELCRFVTDRGVDLIVDTRPAYLAASLAAKPVFVKPSLSELEELLGTALKSHEDICRGAREIISRGAKNVAVSMGDDGAIFANENETLYITAPHIPVYGHVGAGSVMVAGICHGLSNNMDFESLAKYAVASATASVTEAGVVMASRRDILRVYAEVGAERI